MKNEYTFRLNITKKRNKDEEPDAMQLTGKLMGHSVTDALYELQSLLSATALPTATLEIPSTPPTIDTEARK